MPFDALEYAVRPYTAPNAQGQIIIPSTPRSSRDRATITWGSKAEMPPVQSGVNFNTVCCSDDLTEQSRKSTKIRVYQNNDDTSPNWVDYEQPTDLTLNKKEQNSCGDNWDDISGVAAGIDSYFQQFQQFFDQQTGNSPQNCGTSWHFQTQQPQS